MFCTLAKSGCVRFSQRVIGPGELAVSEALFIAFSEYFKESDVTTFKII